MTVNHPVPGSSPGGGVRSNSSAVEHLVYTEAVGGSIPSSSISTLHTMDKKKIKDHLDVIYKEILDLRSLMNDVSNQMQELRDAVRESSNQNEELSLREFYEHPWYKYKRELINTSGDNFQPQGSESTTAD